MMNQRYLNIFSRTELRSLNKFGKIRYNLLKPILKLLSKAGIRANHLSYLGLTLIIGFAYYAQKNPKTAFFFLLAHVLIDGIDGPLARYTRNNDKKGKIVDFVCDHTGLLLITLVLIFNSHIMLINGIIYIMLYTALLLIIITRNSTGKPPMIAARTKYPLYFIYGIIAFTGIDLINTAVILFNILTVVQITAGSIALTGKKGEKYLRPL